MFLKGKRIFAYITDEGHRSDRNVLLFLKKLFNQCQSSAVISFYTVTDYNHGISSIHLFSLLKTIMSNKQMRDWIFAEIADIKFPNSEQKSLNGKFIFDRFEYKNIPEDPWRTVFLLSCVNNIKFKEFLYSQPFAKDFLKFPKFM